MQIIQPVELDDMFQQFIVNLEAEMQKELLYFAPFGTDPNNQYSTLHLAMQYVTMSGGKRMRPLLVRASGLLSDANVHTLTKIGTAIEFIHCYSLVHDDLPAMDNDDLRRGRPTCHKKYGDAIAILVGDALQALAFSILTTDGLHPDVAVQLKLAHLIANCAGANGMVGGQAIDILNTGKNSKSINLMGLEDIQYMHSLKTGKMISASIVAGYICGTVVTETMRQIITKISESIGLLFQIIDDIIDVTGDTVTLGKTANKDITNNKSTYVSILGLEETQRLANELYHDINTKLNSIPKSEALKYLVEFIYTRNT